MKPIMGKTTDTTDRTLPASDAEAKEENPETGSAQKSCPHCGAPLPEEAAFCPHCAQSVNRRTEPKPPKRLPARYQRFLALLLLALLAAAAVLFFALPKTYDALGEVSYTDADGSYQLLINIKGDRNTAMDSLQLYAGDEDSYRFPSRLYISDKYSGVDVSGGFMKKVRSVEVKVEQPSGSASPVQATQPKQDGIFAGTAMVSYIDFTRESPSSSQIIWTLHMTNGDTIRLRMDLSITPTYTYNYDASNADLSSSAALQALLDSLVDKYNQNDTVNIQLPAITYTEPVVIQGRAFNLNGTEENGQRTTFAAGIQLRSQEDGSSWISYFNDIDFAGDGAGVGISTARRVWATGCRFINLKTGALAYGTGWINVQDCYFENTQTGLHINASDSIPSDTHLTGNTFKGNETAVLLEEVPTDVLLNFDDCIFTGNVTDIDNRREQPIDIAGAVFQ